MLIKKNRRCRVGKDESVYFWAGISKRYPSEVIKNLTSGFTDVCDELLRSWFRQFVDLQDLFRVDVHGNRERPTPATGRPDGSGRSARQMKTYFRYGF